MPEAGQPRRYRRLRPAEEAELRTLWEAGCTTVEELAAKFCMSRRGVQAALQRLGARKGAAVGAVTAAVRERVLAEALPAHADLAARAREAKESAYRHALRLEALTMAAAEEAVAELRGAAAIRSLDLAASALARAARLKWLALGLDGRTPPDPAELPELPVRELSRQEVEAIREEQAAEDAALGVASDGDGDGEEASEEVEIVTEGHDDDIAEHIGGNDGLV